MVQMELVFGPASRSCAAAPGDASRRCAARGGATPRARARLAKRRDTGARRRVLPSRDAHGRFVAFPTISAPSWYVFCADAYRIPGNADVMPMQLTAPAVPAPQPLPAARVVRRRRPPVQWDEVATWLLIAVFVVVVGWHGLHLQFPHR